MSPVVRRQGKVMRLALPIMLGMLSQSVLNLVDAALVGHLGEQALAGVGIGGYAMFMVTALVFGLSSSVQSQTAQKLGAGGATPTRPLYAGLIIGMLVGMPLSCLAWWQAPVLLQLMASSDEVQALAVDYFRWRVISLTAIALTLCLRGYWNGLQHTHLYLRIIVIVHVFNVVISAGLIYGVAGLPALGTSGAGIGTTLSLFLGLVIWSWVTLKHTQRSGAYLPGWRAIRTTLLLATPHSVQQLLFAAGYVVLFWLLSKMGTESVAVGHVLINLSLLLILPGVGVGVAVMSLVGEALGRDNKHEAHRWGIDALNVAGMLLTLLALPMLLLPEHVLAIFFTDNNLIQLGSLPLQITAVMIVLDAAALVLAQALMGAGAQRTVMLLTLGMQWFVFLPLAWWVGIGLGYGLLGVWLMQLVYRLLNSTGFLWVWQRRRWQTQIVLNSV
ncbi:MATE family efflux transporter [Vreelandella olivaria]|uniref:MATE family efflux transporter n=1 Tax=Vreelandella olivaria TaxID=390919 RepID=UPI00201ECB8E|nr:MATE family efflux transporter [Halomonas olivaria]